MSDIENQDESLPDNLEVEEDYEEDDESLSARMPKWSELKFIPNRKRFLLLTLIFTIIEISGIMIFTYAFLSRSEAGYFDLGLFVMPIFTGAFLSYLVTSKKEAIAVSGVVGSISISLSLLIYILVEVFAEFPVAFTFNVYTHIAIPIVFLLLEILVAFTLSRMQRIYQKIGESSSTPTKRDEAMIEELRQSRIARGLEDPEDNEN